MHNIERLYVANSTDFEKFYYDFVVHFIILATCYATIRWKSLTCGIKLLSTSDTAELIFTKFPFSYLMWKSWHIIYL